ncbi:MAG: HesA/MoeB/ThiF family protein [Bacteroidaceae bacterium]|nr:HesA/MoeB/ThiF family protein [Bacteroidaceae bacterium]
MFEKEHIDSASVMVAGCGALGNEVVKNLVLTGIRHLVIVDFDVVENGNLTRSVFFTNDDEGRNKVDVLAERLTARYPDIDVQTICGDVAYDVGLGLIREMDVVIGCLDNREARYALNRLCHRANKPWVDGGITMTDGTVRVFVPGKNCYACNLPPEVVDDMKRRASCSGAIRQAQASDHAPTTSITASIVGAVMAQEALKQITGDDSTLCGKMFCYEATQPSARIVEFCAYDEDCPCHEIWSPVKETEISTDMTVGETLALLAEMFPECSEFAITLDDSFVDYVEDSLSGKTMQVMLPSRKVAERLATVHGNVETECAEKSSHIEVQMYNLQNEYNRIDKNFPYQELTLAALGIPERQILPVVTENCEFYIQMNNGRTI